MIRVETSYYGEVQSEKFFKDTDNVEALEYAEGQVTGEPGEEIRLIWKGEVLWSNQPART